MRILVNGKEVRSPAAKILLGLLAMLFIALFLLVVFVVLLPLIGVAVTVSVGLIAFIIIALLGVFMVVMGRTILSAMLGAIARLKRKIKSDSQATTKRLRSTRSVQKL